MPILRSMLRLIAGHFQALASITGKHLAERLGRIAGLVSEISKRQPIIALRGRGLNRYSGRDSSEHARDWDTPCLAHLGRVFVVRTFETTGS